MRFFLLLGVFSFCREVISFAVTVVATVVITRMITDGIERHELLLPLLNQQEVQRVVVITDNHKLFWPRAVETDAFSASFDKSNGLTSCRRQFPKGYVFPLACLIGKKRQHANITACKGRKPHLLEFLKE